MEGRRGTNREIVLIEWLALSPWNRTAIRLMIQIRYCAILLKKLRRCIVNYVLFVIFRIFNI